MINRRNALKIIGSASLSIPFRLNAKVLQPSKTINIGVVADLHIGFYPKAEKRLNAFLEYMKDVETDALIQLGDFAYPDPEHKKYADQFNAAHKNTLHVIGNHDLDKGLTTADCIKTWGMPNRYYAQNINGIRIIVLDGNEIGSPTHAKHGGYPSYIGPEQIKWLKKQLNETTIPVIIASHQPLAGMSELDNAAEIRPILTQHKDKILLCINGHAHVDQHLEIEGVHYLHINSASYYWLGGKVRMAGYKDPLFATLTINPETSTIEITGKESEWLTQSPEEIGYFKNKPEPYKNLVKPRISDRKISLKTHKG